MEVKPLEDRVVVRRVEEVQKGVIVIPEGAREKPQQGLVIAVGRGRFQDGLLIPMETEVGDKVLFSKYAGTEFQIDGVDHLILREDDILAILRGE